MSWHSEVRIVTARASGKYPWLVKQLNNPGAAIDIATLEPRRIIGAGLMGVVCQAELKGTSPKLIVALKVKTAAGFPCSCPSVSRAVVVVVEQRMPKRSILKHDD